MVRIAQFSSARRPSVLLVEAVRLPQPCRWRVRAVLAKAGRTGSLTSRRGSGAGLIAGGSRPMRAAVGRTIWWWRPCPAPTLISTSDRGPSGQFGALPCWPRTTPFHCPSRTGHVRSNGRIVRLHALLQPVPPRRLVDIVPVRRPLMTCGLGWSSGFRRWADIVVVRDSRRFASSLLGVLLVLDAARMSRRALPNLRPATRPWNWSYRQPDGPAAADRPGRPDVRRPSPGEYLAREARGSVRTDMPATRKVRRRRVGAQDRPGLPSWPIDQNRERSEPCPRTTPPFPGSEFACLLSPLILVGFFLPC